MELTGRFLLFLLSSLVYSGLSQDLPKATVTVESPEEPFYPGDTVTLRCDITEGTDWEYYWYRNNTHIPSKTSKTITISLPTESGQYVCSGRRRTRPLNSSSSQAVTVSYQDLPKATVTVESPVEPFYPGDTVTLRCDITQYTDWEYYWYRDNTHIPSKTSKTITISLPTESGQYVCSGRRRTRPQNSYSSQAVTVSYQADLPTPALTVDPQSPVFTGEKVTLKCESEGNTFIIRAASGSDEGRYWCRGEREHSNTNTSTSRDVYLYVKDLPIATVTVVKPQRPFYKGDTVTLRCNITQYTDWEYYWYRDNSHISSKTSKTITISLPTESGQYVCSGRRRTRPLNSSSSQAVTVSYQADLPTPALTVDPQSPVFTGEKVTLKCEVEPSSGWRYKWYKEQSSNVVFQSEGNTFIITAVSGSDEGRYWCRGEREHSNSNTPTSRDVYLYLKYLPKAKVTIVTPQRPFYKGDRVTLRCNITQYTDWEYYWYRDNTHIPSKTSKTITISLPTESGQYVCSGRRRTRPQNSSSSQAVTVSYQGNICVKSSSHGGPPENQTSQKDHDPVEETEACSGEYKSRVTLRRRCTLFKHNFYDTSSTRLQPVFLNHPGQEGLKSIKVRKAAGPGGISSRVIRSCAYQLCAVMEHIFNLSLRLDSMTQGPQQLQAGGSDISPDEDPGVAGPGSASNPVLSSLVYSGLSQDLPKATVTVESPEEPFYPGDTVTLRCDITQYTDWEYYWYRDNSHIPSKTSKTITISLPTESGQYVCSGRRGTRPQYSYSSQAVTFSYQDLPKATVTVESPEETFYPGDTVTLRCYITQYTDWEYYWYRDNSHIPSKTSKTITISLPTESGQYVCSGRRRTRPQYSSSSQAVTVSYQADLPTPALTVDPQSPVFTGEKVTLKCEVEPSSGWRYKWYKEQSSDVFQSEGNTFIIRAASGSDEGRYWCRGEREHSNTNTPTSRDVYLYVIDLPIATVTVVKPQRPFYKGDRVTLRCDITQYTDWEYYWYRDNSHISSKTSKTITISLPTESGQYVCSGRRRTRPQDSSSSQAVTVSYQADLPTPALTVDPQSPVFTGEKVTLKCEVKPSSGWRYKWYKEQSSNVFQSEGNTFIITAASGSNEGRYWCQGEREHSNTNTPTSRYVYLYLKDLPNATVTVESPVEPFYPGDTVTLRCDITQYTDWEYYYWYRDNTHIPSNTSKTITISLPTESGQYVCSGRRKTRPQNSSSSQAVTVSYQADLPTPALTVDPQSPVFTGEKVTLKCEVEPSSGWRYKWYKEQSSNVVFQSEGNTFIITAASGSDEGRYWCRGEREHSNSNTPKSAPVYLSVISSVGVWVGLAAAVIFIILLILLCCLRNLKGRCLCAAEGCQKRRNQESNQNQSFYGGNEAKQTKYDTIQSGSAHVYDNITPAHRSEEAAEPGTDGVTYSEIQMKPIKKKKNTDTVYSMLNLDQDTGDDKPNNMIYADIQKKGKKPKSKSDATLAVYSELKL
ncbi:basement membrane-specific heparan sulfate proteoglycan core protein-like [Denticeps clupeoides]|uniref:basement membrane-specific heparan sulfate proteoglycan core protein-like n=1 Tax=Denticeps clupeoides TaxID=299321 RepID=UPI0010A2E682|nr:basement membrane-specific heparan sulfate proteoglycan core protein-like [Denticeps clupeoides]